MRKLKLDVDDLAVESFDTRHAGAPGRVGTVRGHATADNSCDVCIQYITYEVPSCRASDCPPCDSYGCYSRACASYTCIYVDSCYNACPITE